MARAVGCGAPQRLNAFWLGVQSNHYSNLRRIECAVGCLNRSGHCLKDLGEGRTRFGRLCSTARLLDGFPQGADSRHL